jgi:DNA-directed RNA polymerase subunit RPC12/RpoP
MKLTDVTGISRTKAERLSDNGYLFAEDLAQANAARVDGIDGCSAKLVANAQEYIVKETDTQLGAINYRCGECGRLFHLKREALAKHVRFSKCKDKSDSSGDLFNMVNL